MAKQENTLMLLAAATAAYFLFIKKPTVPAVPPAAMDRIGVTTPHNPGDTWSDYTLDGRYRRTYTALRNGDIRVFIQDSVTGQNSTVLIIA